MSKTRLANAKRLVVKVGSALVTNNGAGLDLAAIEDWARQIAVLRDKGREIVLVSSGAVAFRSASAIDATVHGRYFASSFASAMLIMRKVFSYTFTSSAASGLSTGTMVSKTFPYRLIASSLQRGVMPPW